MAFHQASFGTPYAKPPGFSCRRTVSYRPSSTRARQRLTTLAATPRQRARWPFSATWQRSFSDLGVGAMAAPPLPVAGGHASRELSGPCFDSYTEGKVTINEPQKGSRFLGGFGSLSLAGGLPRRGGLCSPGRWKPEARSLASRPPWDWLREKTLSGGFPDGSWRRTGLLPS